MKNILQIIKELKDNYVNKQAQVLLEEKDLLSKLVEENREKNQNILHPIKYIRNQNEIKKLQAEISAIKGRERNIGILTGGIAVFIILFSIVGIMASLEKNSAGKGQTTEIEAQSVLSTGTEISMQVTEDAMPKIVDTIEDFTMQAITEAVETIPDTGASDTIPVETEITDNKDAALFASDLNVATQTDYAHIDSDSIILGNDEGVTITVRIPMGRSPDEVVVYGDEEFLNIGSKDWDDTQSKFKIYVTGKKAGASEIIIASSYELENKGEQAEVFVLNIHKLDSIDGKIVYVTQSGDKYHYSGRCAGENAIKTTCYDCQAYEYEACGKCVG